MDSYRVATSWGLFGALAIVGAYYYWPQERTRKNSRTDTQPATRAKRRNESELGGKQNGRPSNERSHSSYAEAVKQGGSDGTTRKRKAPTSEPTERQAAPAVVVHAEEPEDKSLDTKRFAEQMAKARQGANLTTNKSKDQRVKTVKQSSAVNTPVLSSGSSQADDDMSPALSPALNGGDVSDMLEPVASGPSTLRVTAPEKPQREKMVRAPKSDDVETKKQRQNRQKAEERKLQRDAEERDRKVAEERQRRIAREARGEAAKNGIPVSKPPKQSVWQAGQVNGTSKSTAAAETANAPLLDTFDAESNSSSNGGLGTSTAATSIKSGGVSQFDHDMPSEEEQLARAMRESEDESGWTTVAQPKKQPKKTTEVNGGSALTNKTNLPSTKPATMNGKPKGFQALEVQYESPADADPSDPSSWAA